MSLSTEDLTWVADSIQAKVPFRSSFRCLISTLLRPFFLLFTFVLIIYFFFILVWIPKRITHLSVVLSYYDYCCLTHVTQLCIISFDELLLILDCTPPRKEAHLSHFFSVSFFPCFISLYISLFIYSIIFRVRCSCVCRCIARDQEFFFPYTPYALARLVQRRSGTVGSIPSKVFNRRMLEIVPVVWECHVIEIGMISTSVKPSWVGRNPLSIDWLESNESFPSCGPSSVGICFRFFVIAFANRVLSAS